MISEAVAANQILWCVAQTFGNTSPNKSNKSVTKNTLIKKTGQKVKCNPVIHPSIKILEIKMMPMFTKLLLISIDANKVFGCSSKLTIRRYAGCFFVRNIFMSLNVREKKAISDPANKKDNIKRITTINISTVVAAGVIAKR